MNYDESQQEKEQNQTDFSEYIDPWKLYEGNQTLTQDLKTEEERVIFMEELRDYASEFAPQQQYLESSHSHESHNFPTPHQHHEHHHHDAHYEHHHSHHQPDYSDNTSEQSHRSNQNQHHQHQQSHQSYYDDHSWPYNKQVNIHQHSIDILQSRVADTCIEHHHPTQQIYQVHTEDDVQMNIKKSLNSSIKKVNPIDLFCITNGFENESLTEKNMDLNEFRPRHPYDGFYLRHVPTIDPRGRKVCRHSLPPSPPPSPPDTPLPSTDSEDDNEIYEDALDTQVSYAYIFRADYNTEQ